MKRIIFLVSVLVSIGATAQEPSEEFLNKLDSIGATDTTAQAQMMYNRAWLKWKRITIQKQLPF